MIRRGGAKEGKGELRDERDKRGSGVRVSSFDPLSLLRLCESRVLPTCPCFDSNESLPPCSPTVRSARARASERSHTLPLFLPLFFPLPAAVAAAADLTAWRATIAIAKPPLSCRLVPLPYHGSPTRRRDGGASRRASLRSRHGDVTPSSVVQ